jgi:type VI secretion system secreted protein Hcp
MAVDMFLKIDGIDGESSDDQYVKHIEIMSFSWGVSQTSTGHTGGGMGAGKVSMQDISFVAHVSKATPLLMKACCQGEHFKKATLFIRKSGGDQQDQNYLTYTLEDCLISSFQAGGGGGDDRPMESLSLNFSKVQVTYLEQKPDGSLGEPITGSCAVGGR